MTARPGHAAPTSPRPPAARRPARPPADSTYPLTYGQQGMWFLERMTRPVQYLDPGTFRLTGELSEPALRHSLVDVVRRHDALRTAFPTADGRPVQRVAPEPDLPYRLHDLNHLGPRERETTAAALLEADLHDPFDLAQGPPIRVTLVRLAPDEHLIRLTLHHLVSDAWSGWEVIFREWGGLYRARLRGAEPTLPPPAAQYGDFVAWQTQWCDGPVYARQRDYWQRTLAGAPPLPDLPLAAPGDARPEGGQNPSATERLTLPGPLATSLREVARRERVSLFMLLLAAFDALLYHHTNTTDLVVGTRAALRTRPGFEQAVGFFVNVLPIRARVDPAAPFTHLLHEVRHSSLGAYTHREMPFEKLLAELGLRWSPGSFPLANVLFTFQSAPEAPPALDGLTVAAADQDPQSPYALDAVIKDSGGELRMQFTYHRSRYAPEAVHRLMAQLRDLLDAVARDTGASTDALLARATATDR
uniref:Dst24 n=1 Tax=Streptomyces netropsis TaxID=55404 RepID=W0I672_STRNE|nr:long-chain-fatty-acid--CoA ligase [Streptomyces netropsis]AIS24866.1 Dst24 [Streptomyces netropsis]